MSKKTYVILVGVFLSLVQLSCTNNPNRMEKRLSDFIGRLNEKVIPLFKEAAGASWDASISGMEKDYRRSEEAQLKLVKIFSDTALFAELRTIKESGKVKEPLLKRQMELLFPMFLRNQVDPSLLEKKIRLESGLEKKYSNFRAVLNGESMSDNQLEEILKSSTDSRELEAAWKAHKTIGREVAADIIKLVKVRNQIARELGFSDYHQMNMTLSEQNPDEVLALFDELDSLTANNFAQLKDEIDAYLANRYSLRPDQLMPWHYQNRYFQEAPKIYSVDLDRFYADKDLVKLTRDFYAGIGLDVDDIIARSDLFEKPGKNQHAYCTDIDRAGDVRVLANVRPTYSWMNTMLHEFGHAVYAKFNDNRKPYLLRDAAHSFTTEAVAMLMGRLAADPMWMLRMGLIDEEQKNEIAGQCFNALRLEQLTFSRWAQVMYRFEKELYANPDQDLNSLWWRLVEKYQRLRKPADRDEPDWATKVHVALYPCYYHNYLLGELLASQLQHYISVNLLGGDSFKSADYVGKPAVGDFLREKIFYPGCLYSWNEMIQRATGEKLTAKYYAMQFVK